MDEEDPVIRTVLFGADEYGGPFWDDEGHISSEYDELHRWLGISRELYDDAMAWNDEVAPTRGTPEDPQRRNDLLRRLADEVHPWITVRRPRD